MPMLNLTFRLFITEAQEAKMKEEQDIGEFGAGEAIELCQEANDCALIRVDD